MLDIVTLPDERLHRVSVAVENIDSSVFEFTQSMVSTMITAKGIGLAAVQVGRFERIFIAMGPDDTPMVFINPQILALSSELSNYEEGCLSIPGVYAEVRRPEALEISAYNEHGKPVRFQTDGLLARIIQHEADHLEGILFHEHLRPGVQKRLLNLYERRMRA